MGVPTRSQVNGWVSAHVGQVPQMVKPTVERIDTSADTMQRTITDLHWSGLAKDAAGGRADNERTQMRRIARAFEDLGKACTTGADAMGPMIDGLRSSATNLEADSFAVADTWVVTDTNNYAAAFAACGDDQRAIDSVTQLQQRRSEEAKNETVRLQRLATDLGDADLACAKAIDAANENVRSLAPTAAGLSASGAQKDLDEAAHGSASAEVLDRIHSATQLSDEQKDALAHGKPVDMPQGQFDYLNEVMRSQDGMSVEDIEKLGSDLSPDRQQQLRADLANGMQLMSNPSVHAAGVSLGGQPPVSVDHGGMDRLPTQVRSLVTENPVQNWTALRTSDDGSPLTPETTRRVRGVEITRAGDFESLNKVLGSGDKALAQGSDLDRGVIKQASEIAAATRDPDVYIGKQTDAFFDDPDRSDAFFGDRHDRDQANQMVSTMLENAGGDRTAVHDAFTGQNMNVTCDEGGTYNATDHLDGLLNRDWQGHEQGISTVLNTIGDNAASPDPAVNAQTGETARALAGYVGTHKDQLLDLHPGNGGVFGTPGEDSIGQLNPKTTQALSGALGHYIPNMVGVEEEFLDSHNFTPLTSDETKDLFAVIDSDGSDNGAAVSFNQVAYSSVSQLDYQFGLSNGEHSRLGEYAGRIDWAAQNGMNDELSTRIYDAAEMDKARSDIWDTVKEGATFGAGKIPRIGEALSGSVDIAAPEAKSWLLGSVPDQHARADISGEGSAASRYHNILQGMVESPEGSGVTSDPRVERYLDRAGDLRTMEDIIDNAKARNLPIFNEDMTSFLPNLTAYEAAWDNGRDPRESGW